jgi:hypothetical protein
VRSVVTRLAAITALALFCVTLPVLGLLILPTVAYFWWIEGGHL